MRELILSVLGERDIVVIDENEGVATILTPIKFQNFVETEVEPLKEVTTNLYCHFGHRDYSVSRIITRFSEEFQCRLGLDKFKFLMQHMDLAILENPDAAERKKRTRLIIGKEKLFFISYSDYRANILFKKDLLDIIKEDGEPKLHKRCRVATEIDGVWYNLSYVKDIVNKYFDYYFADAILKEIFAELGHPFVAFTPNCKAKREIVKKAKIQEKYFDRYRRDWY